jgi:uncharacterized protein (TIGR02996 family)
MAGIETYPDPSDHPEVNGGGDPDTGWLASLAKNGHDSLTRLIFSDWLREHGYENAANGQAKAASLNARPLEPNHKGIRGFFPGGGWFTDNGIPFDGNMRPSASFNRNRLPPAYFYNHPELHNIIGHRGDPPTYKTPTEQEAAFLTAAHKTPHDENGEPMLVSRLR